MPVVIHSANLYPVLSFGPKKQMCTSVLPVGIEKIWSDHCLLFGGVLWGKGRSRKTNRVGSRLLMGK